MKYLVHAIAALLPAACNAPPFVHLALDAPPGVPPPPCEAIEVSFTPGEGRLDPVAITPDACAFPQDFDLAFPEAFRGVPVVLHIRGLAGGADVFSTTDIQTVIGTA